MKTSAMLSGIALSILLVCASNLQAQVSFPGPELLGRPTNDSIVLNVVANANIQAYVEYGTASGIYSQSTAVTSGTANVPLEFVLSGLTTNTRYYYRLRYRTGTTGEFSARSEHTFHTPRPRGSSFTFTLISDSHLNHLGTPSVYSQATVNVAADNPDFHLDLGDAFVTNGLTTQAAVNTKYLNQRSYFGNFSHSAPVFLSAGNHENEEGWNFDDTYPLPIYSINARRMYYPTPFTDGFYSGNDDLLGAIGGDHRRLDYYAWEWGDALFVVIDPFQYTMTNPYGAVAGEGSDDPASGDQWNWTLGLQQFNWLKQTLENSTAPFKFVFSHQVTGGQLSVPGGAGGPGYVRGGANAVPYFEWGGQNADGTWGFDTKRPGWGGVPIHQLMVNNGVSAYFHGHDHEYAYEVRDGIVYQEVPSASMDMSYGFSLYSESDPYTERVLQSSGHLRVTVTPTQTAVDYVRSGTPNGTVSYSYTIDPNPLPITLGTFSARYDARLGGVKLEWTTVSEVNNYGFYVQKREGSGRAFEDLPNSFVAGHGTTLKPQTYVFIHNTPPGAGQLSYRLRQVDLDGSEHLTEAISLEGVLPSLTEAAPSVFQLLQNHPNPFNPSTLIRFSVQVTGHTTLHVYNVLGEVVVTLFDGVAEAGRYYQVQLSGAQLSSGVYFYRLQSGETSALKRMLLLK